MTQGTNTNGERMMDEPDDNILPPAGFTQLEAPRDSFPSWRFDDHPILDGRVIEARTIELDREGEIRDVRVAVVEVGLLQYTLWEAYGLKSLFNVMRPGMKIWIHSKGLKPLKNGRTMREFDVYHD